MLYVKIVIIVHIKLTNKSNKNGGFYSYYL